MVQSYFENSHTIILAVLPCNVDVTTQEILEMAERADPEGVRTIGVLTKPDLVTEVDYAEHYFSFARLCKLQIFGHRELA
jgi:hypothetical protein